MIDYQELKRLAEAATPGKWSTSGSYVAPSREEASGTVYVESWRPIALASDDIDREFIAAANPAALLELIAEVETLGSYLCTCPDCGGEGEIFAGTYSYFGHMDPPEPNMDKCVECDGKGLIGTPQNLQTVIAERDQLKAEVEAMRKDTERLNFIESNKQKTLRIYKRKWSFEGFTNYEYPVFKSLRECIDSAMSREVGR